MGTEGVEVDYWYCPECRRQIPDEVMLEILYDFPCPTESCMNVLSDYLPVRKGYNNAKGT